MKKEYLISFYPDNKSVKINGSKTILDASNSLGIYLTSVCDGAGTCGKCKIVVEEGEVVTEGEESGNEYLACKTFPRSDLKITIPEESRLGAHQILEHAHGIERDELIGDAGLALDIGTTTVVAYLVDLNNKKIVDSASGYNKQMIHGEDVLSRINYCENHGTEKLNKLLVESINALITKLLADREGVKVKEVSAAGNTTMSFILLNKNPVEIKKYTELPEFKTPYEVNAASVGINALGSLYVLPGIASYVGGDIVADILYSGMHESEGVSLLIDVGTNGEIAIGNKDWLVACSTSAGPAFEGGEVGSGMRATTGAIEEIKINEDLRVEYGTIHNDRPRGICGSGLIDLLAELYLWGILDHKGKFLPSKTGRVRDSKQGREFVIVEKEESASGKDIVLSEKDIEKILFSKAAIYSGASALSKVGVDFSNLDRVIVAGGFGYYINIDNAITLGLLPDLPRDKFKFIGNGSAEGAFQTLVSSEKRKTAADIAKKTTYFDLSSSRDFSEEYMVSLYIPHMDERLFPSVERRKR